MKKGVSVLKKSLVCLILVSLVFASVSLLGCQAEAPKPAAGGAPSTPSTPSAPKPKYIAVGEATYAPFEYVDEKTGKPAGFDVDLISAIAEVSGFDVEYKNLDWNSLVPSVQNKEADFIVSGYGIDNERSLEVTFSDPYFCSGQAWAVKEGSPIKALTDLAGKTVAVQINSTGDSAVQKMSDKFVADKKKPVTIKRLKLGADLFNELKVGGCDALVADLPAITEYMKSNPGDKVVVPEPAFTVEYFGIAMRKADKDLHQLVNKGLAKIKASGKYDEIYAKYFGSK